MSKAEVLGVILAGGRSKRMGRPKARLMMDGQTLIQRVIDRLGRVCPELIVVTDRPASFADLPLAVVADLVPNLGPLGGLFTAATLWPDRALLAAGCDAPFLEPDLLEALVRAGRGHDQIVIARFGVHLEPLPALFPAKVRVPLTGLIRAGERQVRALWDAAGAHVLDEASVRAVDPEGHSFVNLNTPEEAARWRAK
ncbi:MAG: molybdenum cofactor guanylyltransferase [Proteobacteria bacterium]|nr:molybdenum cofactor guanylyltransferase [Pseudomonadota bacterium]MBU1742035.1 molybdenum cofactor guanylyltransferase [Pseudomonadota bacterium]